MALYQFSVQAACEQLWDIGMDDCPYRCGYLTDELTARDGQYCEVLQRGGGEWQESQNSFAVVRWADGLIERITAFGLEKAG